MPTMIRFTSLLWVTGIFIAAGAAQAFNPPVDTCGSLTVEIGAPDVLGVGKDAVPVTVTLTNRGTTPLTGSVRLEGIDDWAITPASQDFSLQGGAAAPKAFQVLPAAASYNAFYPLHAWVDFEEGGIKQQAHAIFIASVQNPQPPQVVTTAPWKPWVLTGSRNIALTHLPTRRVSVDIFNEAPRLLGNGWAGVDTATGAVLEPMSRKARPDSREAERVHPAWRDGKPGAVISEYALQLPAAPARLLFSMAMRDTQPGEPSSDGVTWRVRVAPFDSPEAFRGEVACEKHWDGKIWQEAEADLSRWAGQVVRLQLETHPGPKNDTTCDECYWGDVRLCFTESAAEAESPIEYAVGRHCFALGSRGLMNGVIILDAESRPRRIAGLPVRLFGESLADTTALSEVAAAAPEAIADGWAIRHGVQYGDEKALLITELTAPAPGDMLKIQCRLEEAPAPIPWRDIHIEDISLGPWEEPVTAIYAGVGNVIKSPEDFELPADGHQLSTSFAGYSFDSGRSVIQRIDTPPSRLEHSKDKRITTIHAGCAGALWLLPCDTVWKGVARLAEALKEEPTAPGVPTLRGRFVFDIWGGKYAESAAALEKAFDYGLTDSIVIEHNWQRWGYDYRLPDILPPNPEFGSSEEFSRLITTCKEHGVLFAPHDNYIDYYPDAPGFSYKKIGFHSNGAPVAAWYNEYRKAQAYRWDIDAFQPLMEKNLHAIQDTFAPTGYFVDVWSSIGIYDSMTWDGRFINRLETRESWRNAFAAIRTILGGAVTISESGHDQLIGWLDGSTANHLRVDPNPPKEGAGMTWRITCADAERIPWFDALYHERFVAHGAGYDPRYRAGLDPRMHGIYSDDYITAEVMTGHPPMVDAPFGRDIVRKYWLLHDLQAALRQGRITDVVFADENIHHQQIFWTTPEASYVIYINRGKEDWTPESSESALPPYGFIAVKTTGEGSQPQAGITRHTDGIIGEWSRADEAAFYNARPVVNDFLPFRVTLDDIAVREKDTLTVALTWERTGPVSENWMPFVHFVDAEGKILFQADPAFPAAISDWTGPVHTEGLTRIPESLDLSAPIELRVGLYHADGRRAFLEGEADPERRLRLVRLQLTRTNGAPAITEKTAVTGTGDEWMARMNPKRVLMAFPAAAIFPEIKTNGAFRMTRRGDAWIITPLPQSPAFIIALRQTGLRVTAAGEDPVSVREENGWTLFETDPAMFEYRLTPASS